MNFILGITLASAICGIISFFTTPYVKSNKWLWFTIVFILTLATGFAVHYSSELERIKSIHRQANAICSHYHSSYNKEFIQEVLAFLEENKDIYPDSYDRAIQIYVDMKSSIVQYDYEPAQELHGIIKAIAALNGEE